MKSAQASRVSLDGRRGAALLVSRDPGHAAAPPGHLWRSAIIRHSSGIELSARIAKMTLAEVFGR